MARLEEGVEILTQPIGRLALAVDRPLQERAAGHGLYGAREPAGVAFLKLAGGDRLVEQPFDLGMNRAGVRQRMTMESGSIRSICRNARLFDSVSGVDAMAAMYSATASTAASGERCALRSRSNSPPIPSGPAAANASSSPRLDPNRCTRVAGDTPASRATSDRVRLGPRRDTTRCVAARMASSLVARGRGLTVRL